MVEKKVRVCDRCDENIAKKVCETCDKDICEYCIKPIIISVADSMERIINLNVCEVCHYVLRELEFPKDPDLKKELLEKIKNLMMLENLKDKPKKSRGPVAVAWPVPRKKTNLWSKRMIGKGMVKTPKTISTGHPMSNTGTFKFLK